MTRRQRIAIKMARLYHRDARFHAAAMSALLSASAPTIVVTRDGYLIQTEGDVEVATLYHATPRRSGFHGTDGVPCS